MIALYRLYRFRRQCGCRPLLALRLTWERSEARATLQGWQETAREFAAVYRLYRQAHGPRYSLLTAWRVAVRGMDF